MRAFKNLTLVLPGGKIIVPVGIASAVAEPPKVDRSVKVGAEYHAVSQIEVDELTREPIDYTAIAYGIKNGDGTFSEVDAEALAKAKDDSKLETLEIMEFIDASELDPLAHKSTYYLQPQRRFPMVARAMRLLFDGMKAEKKVAVVKVCLRDRQSRGIIAPHSSGALVLHTLAWAEQIREPDEEVLALQAEALKPAERKAARELVRGLSTDGAAFATMRDDLIVAVEELLEKATRGAIATGASPEQVAKAVDIMEAIEQTLANLQAATKPKRKSKAAAAR